MPHDNFFINTVKADAAKIKSFQERRKREIELQAQATTGGVVVANGLYFRFKHEKPNSTSSVGVEETRKAA